MLTKFHHRRRITSTIKTFVTILENDVIDLLKMYLIFWSRLKTKIVAITGIEYIVEIHLVKFGMKNFAEFLVSLGLLLLFA